MSEKKTEKQTHLKWFGIPRLLPFLKPYRRLFLQLMVFGLISSLGEIIYPLFQRYAINHYIAEGTLDTLPVFILLYLCVMGLSALSVYLAHDGSAKLEIRVAHDIRETCFHHLQTLSFSYFNQNSVGYIHARVMSDTSRIGTLISWSCIDGVYNLTYIIGAAAVMLSINWRLALLVLAVIPLFALTIVLFQKKVLPLNRRVREINSQITGDFNEAITGAETVKTMNAEGQMEKEFTARTSQMRRTATTAARWRAMFGSAITFASSLALALVLWRGGQITATGVMEIGTLSVFISYALGIMEPVRWLIDALSDLVTTQVNIERVTNLIATESDVADRPEVVAKYGDTFHPKKENWESLHGDVEFDDVTFRYPDGEVNVLEHFSLKVPQGTNVAIVGETGAGKSTLVNLVCRFYEPTAGRILIDGRDARERSQLWLHSNIGYVLQTPHLFSGTVRENLLYGNPAATEEQIMRALRRVSADEIVARMDNGLDSEVGEGGDRLSTGEKQLISFARALLADPKILVLDEATASIDTITEQKIQNAIGEVIAGRTSFVIAHRLSTIRHADVILVVSDGKIIERGTHAELMSQKGAYYNLYTRQFEEDATRRMLDGE